MLKEKGALACCSCRGGRGVRLRGPVGLPGAGFWGGGGSLEGGADPPPPLRSEEGGVGKEGRFGWSAFNKKKKK